MRNELGQVDGNALALALADRERLRRCVEAGRTMCRRLGDENRELRKKLGEEIEDEYIPLPGGEERVRKFAQRALEEPTSRLDWSHLDAAESALGEDAYWGLWDRVMDEAATDVESGHAAAIVAQPNASPAERARFHVIRDGLIEEWQPRPGSEMILIDMLCQVRWAYEMWFERNMYQAVHGCLGMTTNERELKEWGSWYPPRLSDAEAVDHSAAMVFRFQNQFVKLLRALRDLRRHAPSLVIQNAGQVNVGERQLNVAGSATGAEF